MTSAMTHTQLYITWIILALILVAIGSVGRAVDLLREEVEEFRQHMMGEVKDDDHF